MFIDRLLNDGNGPLLEQMLQFAAQRHRLLSEDIVNVDTPGYRQKDLSLVKFQGMLRERVQQRRESAPGTVRFDDIGLDVEHPRNLLFHDGNNRSMEQLMGDFSKNALMHQMAIELLRKQYGQLDMALKEKVG
jgi:flagellar basal-body rod protein FlgB